MITFVPTVTKVSGGFRPMIVARNAKGQCVGSKTATDKVFADKWDAKTYALNAALVASLRSDIIKVA
jgi:hypothetical protein